MPDLDTSHDPTSAGWPDAFTRAALQLVADGLTELAGFEVAAISVVDEEDTLRVAVVSGPADAREHLTGLRTPLTRLREDLERADDWGHFKFVPHERLEDGEPWGWVASVAPVPDAGAWHPLDLLIAPLCDADGTLRGTLAIDLPRDGRRPDAERRVQLERFADQAERAVVSALERERLARQVRLAEAAREVVRQASRELQVASVVDLSSDALLSSFGLVGLWVRVLDPQGGESRVTQASSTGPLPPAPRTGEAAGRMAARLWAEQTVRAYYAGEEPEWDDPDNLLLHAYADLAGVGSLLLVPIGVGEECLGSITLARGPRAPRWSEIESRAAAEIGRDLGRALLSTLAYEREQRLVRELRELDGYKSRLVATVSQELSRPLTAITEGIERLELLTAPGTPRRFVGAMERSARRMVRLVDDLNLLSRVADPETPIDARPVDLVPIVREVCQLTEVAAEQGGLTVGVRAAPFTPMEVLGDPGELDRVVLNLVSNAVKYTPPGGAITVSLRRSDDVVELVVADDGIGISKADQQLLFTEFFRSTNPAALNKPGTGLGLAIVDRIVRRHGGRVEVESDLGVGSTFTVTLPSVTR